MDHRPSIPILSSPSLLSHILIYYSEKFSDWKYLLHKASKKSRNLLWKSEIFLKNLHKSILWNYPDRLRVEALLKKLDQGSFLTDESTIELDLQYANDIKLSTGLSKCNIPPFSQLLVKNYDKLPKKFLKNLNTL